MDAKGMRTEEQPKRRACDECRARKVACSKEVDGCDRCRREGIKCVYSPQKRMGRPRKDRHVETAEQDIRPNEAPEQVLEPVVFPMFEFDSTIGMDLDLTFLDMNNNADLNFLELIDPNNSVFPPAPVQAFADQITAGPPKLPPGHDSETLTDFFPMMSGQLGEINFDEPLSVPPPRAPEITAEDVARIISADLAERPPSLSPPSSSSPGSQPSPPEQESAQTCGCMAALYLALDSLQTLPKRVDEAMRVARTASKTAHDTILCRACGDPPLQATCRTHVQAVQSMMMLGALLPSISNASMRILGMVDAEAAAADAEGRAIRFALGGYGGLWGPIVRLDVVACGAVERLDDALLEPPLWRLTVRALLKMDVYGINDGTCGADLDGLRQPGLKDIIDMMEERSRRRHQQVDAMVASGVLEKPPDNYVPLSSTSDKPTCLRIIDIAKKSMEELVIP